MLLMFSIPYNYAAWGQEGLNIGQKLLVSLNPVWLIQKYMSTLASYPYFTINAFNFFAMLKLNWVSLEVGGSAQTLLNILNYAMILLAIGGALIPVSYTHLDVYKRQVQVLRPSRPLVILNSSYFQEIWHIHVIQFL